ncbi:hypothetical protein [Halomarina litorea]|nr:hypothetical protein [Halomarina sp. BCD28]
MSRLPPARDLTVVALLTAFVALTGELLVGLGVAVLLNSLGRRAKRGEGI